MATVICPKCKGMKRILGMGMLERDCDHCGKTGRVSADSVSPVAENNSTQLRDDLRTLSNAYTETQAENEKLKAQIADLSAKAGKEPKSKPAGKSK
jgi:hypothetical protein